MVISTNLAAFRSHHIKLLRGASTNLACVAARVNLWCGSADSSTKLRLVWWIASLQRGTNWTEFLKFNIMKWCHGAVRDKVELKMYNYKSFPVQRNQNLATSKRLNAKPRSQTLPFRKRDGPTNESRTYSLRWQRGPMARFWIFLRNICAFLEKRSFTVKVSKFCSESFHRDTDRRCCVQISWNLADEKSVKSCVIYQTKISFASQTVATARISPKICQTPTMYSECSKFHRNLFTFGGVIADRLNTAKSPVK